MPRGIYPRKPRRAVADDSSKRQAGATITDVADPSKTIRVHSDTGPAETAEPAEISSKTERLIDQVRQPFKQYSHGFGAVLTTRAELAPKFMRAFDAWKSETEGSFVRFVQLFDPTVPEAFAEYRNHKTFQAADYLARLVRQQERGERTPVDAAHKPATPLVALARLVATVLPAVDPAGALWAAFVREMHWSPQQADRVRALGQKEGAIQLRGKTAKLVRLAAAA
jgi:hypothetical protein